MTIIKILLSIINQFTAFILEVYVRFISKYSWSISTVPSTLLKLHNKPQNVQSVYLQNINEYLINCQNILFFAEHG